MNKHGSDGTENLQAHSHPSGLRRPLTLSSLPCSSPRRLWQVLLLQEAFPARQRSTDPVPTQPPALTPFSPAELAPLPNWTHPPARLPRVITDTGTCDSISYHGLKLPLPRGKEPQPPSVFLHRRQLPSPAQPDPTLLQPHCHKQPSLCSSILILVFLLPCLRTQKVLSQDLAVSLQNQDAQFRGVRKAVKKYV